MGTLYRWCDVAWHEAGSWFFPYKNTSWRFYSSYNTDLPKIIYYFINEGLVLFNHSKLPESPSINGKYASHYRKFHKINNLVFFFVEQHIYLNNLFIISLTIIMIIIIIIWITVRTTIWAAVIENLSTSSDQSESRIQN